MSESKPEAPCPHCGEYLVRHDDRHGEWWAHRDYPKSGCAHGVTQLFDGVDFAAWNTRSFCEQSAREGFVRAEEMLRFQLLGPKEKWDRNQINEQDYLAEILEIILMGKSNVDQWLKERKAK